MPKTKIRIYRDSSERVPLLGWLDVQPEAVQIKCIAKIKRLENLGFELRRPECDYLSEGIYELRVRAGNVNYRVLYGFIGRQIVLLLHGCVKEKRVSKKEISRARRRLLSYKKDPRKHTFNGKLYRGQE